jgi:hypothetical protein
MMAERASEGRSPDHLDDHAEKFRGLIEKIPNRKLLELRRRIRALAWYDHPYDEIKQLLLQVADAEMATDRRKAVVPPVRNLIARKKK